MNVVGAVARTLDIRALTTDCLGGIISAPIVAATSMLATYAFAELAEMGNRRKFSYAARLATSASMGIAIPGFVADLVGFAGATGYSRGLQWGGLLVSSHLGIVLGTDAFESWGQWTISTPNSLLARAAAFLVGGVVANSSLPSSGLLAAGLTSFFVSRLLRTPYPALTVPIVNAQNSLAVLFALNALQNRYTLKKPAHQPPRPQ